MALWNPSMIYETLVGTEDDILIANSRKDCHGMVEGKAELEDPKIH